MPSSYVYALERYVGAKHEVLSKELSLATTVRRIQQGKYVAALLKQLHAMDNRFSSQMAKVHPPDMSATVSRQGPFLLQPSSLELAGSLLAYVTDFAYISCTSKSCDGDISSDILEKGEQLDVILLSMENGQIDVLLDLEKVEAKWDIATV